MSYNSKSYRKFLATLVSTSMVSSAVVTVSPFSVGAESADVMFKDVKPTDHYCEAVKSLV
jgi:hypothetical protein